MLEIVDIKFDSLQSAVSYDLETAGGLALKRVPAALLFKKGFGLFAQVQESL